MEMHISLLMDRPIDENQHYISPGSFTFNFGGMLINFDFIISLKNYCEDPRMVEFVMCQPDVNAFPDAIKLYSKAYLKDIRKIEECYVYTGEYEDPSIHVERINHMEFELDGEIYPVPESVLMEYNEVLAGELEKNREQEQTESVEIKEMVILPRQSAKGY